MVPAFVIGLREGLEAALIVGIIGAFLVSSGNRHRLRGMWAGVAAAAAVCLAAGIGLDVVNRELPEGGQEALELLVAMVATGMITYMLVWMRRHAATLRRDLQDSTNAAIVTGSAAALVGMAFFAVFREGFETAVFMVAAFGQSTDPALTGTGVVLGLLGSAAVGWGIYRGGIRFDLARFFRATGVVLVIVAAGLLASAVSAAQELGLVGMEHTALNLSGLVDPSTIVGALMTGMLGVRPEPTEGEVLAWLLYVALASCLVLGPRRRGPRPTRWPDGTTA